MSLDLVWRSRRQIREYRGRLGTGEFTPVRIGRLHECFSKLFHKRPGRIKFASLVRLGGNDSVCTLPPLALQDNALNFIELAVGARRSTLNDVAPYFTQSTTLTGPGGPLPYSFCEAQLMSLDVNIGGSPLGGTGLHNDRVRKR